MDGDRNDVSADHGESYKCAERQCGCLTCVYSQVVVYNIHTQSKPDVSGLRHSNTVDLSYFPVGSDSFI